MPFEEIFSVHRLLCTKIFTGFNFCMSKKLDLSWITTFVNIKKFMNLWKFPENLKKSEHKILSNNIWSCFFLNYVTGYVTGLATMSNVYFIFCERVSKAGITFFWEWALERKCHMYHFLWNGPKIAKFPNICTHENMFIWSIFQFRLIQ